MLALGCGGLALAYLGLISSTAPLVRILALYAPLVGAASSLFLSAHFVLAAHRLPSADEARAKDLGLWSAAAVGGAALGPAALGPFSHVMVLAATAARSGLATSAAYLGSGGDDEGGGGGGGWWSSAEPPSAPPAPAPPALPEGQAEEVAAAGRKATGRCTSSEPVLCHLCCEHERQTFRQR